MITIGLGAQALLANEIEKLTSCAQFYTSKVIEAEDKEFGKILHDFTKTQPCGIKRNKAGKLAKITPANQRAKAQHWCGTAFHEPEWNPLYMQYLCYQQEIGQDQRELLARNPNHTPVIHFQYFMTTKKNQLERIHGTHGRKRYQTMAPRQSTDATTSFSLRQKGRLDRPIGHQKRIRHRYLRSKRR